MQKKTAITIVKIVASLLIFYIVAQKLNFKKIEFYLSTASYWYFIPALLSFLISKFISAYRLNLFYKTKQLYLSNPLNIRLYFLSMYYGLFVPGVGGDAFKIYWLNKTYRFSLKDSFWTALLDRISGIVALTALLILFFNSSITLIPYQYLTYLLIPLLFLAHYFIIQLFFKEYLSVFGKSSIYSLVVQALQVSCTWFILKALNCNDQPAAYIFIFLVSCYAYLIPVVGVREAAFVLGAQLFGLNPELSAAISILFYACLAITSLTGIYYFFLPEKLKPEQGSLQTTKEV